MKYTLYILLSFTVLFTACAEKEVNSLPAGQVYYDGALKNVMNGDLKSKKDMVTMSDMPNLYALGALAGLSGEIQVFDSQPYNSIQSEKMAIIDSSFNAKAAFLVYAQVPEWEEIEVPRPILTMKQFEDYVEYTAEKAGIDTSKPFPFLLEGYVRKINWHIVNWDPNMGSHSIAAHKNSGLNGVAVNEPVEIIGFYSNAHQGEFTHHSSNQHMHFTLKNRKLGGHVDDFILGEYMTLKLPKQ